MSYLIYISYTPYTVYVIHNLCICLPVNGWWDHCLLYLRITWKSVDSLPSGNAWSERCLLWIAPQLPMVRLASFITFSPPSAVHHPNICSPANARSKCWSLTKHWSDWCCLLLPDNCFRTCTMLPMLTMYTCAQKHDDLASHRPPPCTGEKELKACSMVSHFLTDSYFLVSQVQEPLCAPIRSTKLTRLYPDQDWKEASAAISNWSTSPSWLLKLQMTFPLNRVQCLHICSLWGVNNIKAVWAAPGVAAWCPDDIFHCQQHLTLLGGDIRLFDSDRSLFLTRVPPGLAGADQITVSNRRLVSMGCLLHSCISSISFNTWKLIRIYFITGQAYNWTLSLSSFSFSCAMIYWGAFLC